MNLRKFALALGLAICAPVFAQGYLSGPALNKKIVTDFYRLVFEPRNSDLIDQFIAPDFVEHNPSGARSRSFHREASCRIHREYGRSAGGENKQAPASMKVVLSDRAAIAIADAPLSVTKAFYKQLAFLERDLHHPSLRAKKYDEAKDIWQARVTRNWPFYFNILDDT